MASKKTKTAEVEYVIRYDGTSKSYFSQMTGIGPAFGATLAKTPRYPTEDEARNVIRSFPWLAQPMCEIKKVMKRKK
jgi:hypothetical protein